MPRFDWYDGSNCRIAVPYGPTTYERDAPRRQRHDCRSTAFQNKWHGATLRRNLHVILFSKPHLCSILDLVPYVRRPLVQLPSLIQTILKEEQRKFPVERGLVDRVKRLFQLKSHPDLARYVRLSVRELRMLNSLCFKWSTRGR